MLNLQNTRIAVAVITIVIWIWVALVATGHAGYEIAPLCHGDLHECTTDTECEAEEELFLTLDLSAYIEPLDLLNMQYETRS